jgi:hypothetical protein
LKSMRDDIANFFLRSLISDTVNLPSRFFFRLSLRILYSAAKTPQRVPHWNLLAAHRDG